MFTIEKNIPIPANGEEPRAGYLKYPFKNMEVGDSFKVTYELMAEKNTNIERIRQAASQFKNRAGMEFTILKEDGGYRVWRKA